MSATATRLGARVLRSPNFGVLATLFQAQDGSRNDHGEWVEGQFRESQIRLVTAPMSGRERSLMPEGLRDKELRKFWLTEVASSIAELTEGDAIRHEGRNYRVEMSSNWQGFYEVVASYPFSGDIDVSTTGAFSAAFSAAFNRVSA